MILVMITFLQAVVQVKSMDYEVMIFSGSVPAKHSDMTIYLCLLLALSVKGALMFVLDLLKLACRLVKPAVLKTTTNKKSLTRQHHDQASTAARALGLTRTMVKMRPSPSLMTLKHRKLKLLTRHQLLQRQLFQATKS